MEKFHGEYRQMIKLPPDRPTAARVEKIVAIEQSMNNNAVNEAVRNRLLDLRKEYTTRTDAHAPITNHMRLRLCGVHVDCPDNATQWDGEILRIWAYSDTECQTAYLALQKSEPNLFKAPKPNYIKIGWNKLMDFIPDADTIGECFVKYVFLPLLMCIAIILAIVVIALVFKLCFLCLS